VVWIETYMQKNMIFWRKYIFHVTIAQFYPKIFINWTIFYVSPKIFNNRTIFAKFVSHFSGRELVLFLWFFFRYEISIEFLELNLFGDNYDAKNCTNATDYILIVEPSRTPDAQSEGHTFCGTSSELKLLHFKSSTNKIEVMFVSNEVVKEHQGKGFQLKVRQNKLPKYSWKGIILFCIFTGSSNIAKIYYFTSSCSSTISKIWLYFISRLSIILSSQFSPNSENLSKQQFKDINQVSG